MRVYGGTERGTETNSQIGRDRQTGMEKMSGQKWRGTKKKGKGEGEVDDANDILFTRSFSPSLSSLLYFSDTATRDLYIPTDKQEKSATLFESMQRS